MVYKNFFLRSIFSLFFIVIFLFIYLINFNYVFFLIILIYFFIFLEIFLNFKSYKYIPLTYICISFLFFLSIDFNEIKITLFNIFIFAVILFDIFSYLIGSLFGKTKFIKISPNKTLEGFFGGLIISFITTMILVIILDLGINLNLLLFTIIIILSSFFGDVIESYFKRKNNLKNSSNLIPGHGGLFDRFDSFSFSIIFYSIFINFIL